MNCCIAQAGALSAFLTKAVNISSSAPCRELTTFDTKQFIPLNIPEIGPTKAFCALVTSLSATLYWGTELNIVVAIVLSPPLTPLIIAPDSALSVSYTHLTLPTNREV